MLKTLHAFPEQGQQVDVDVDVDVDFDVDVEVDVDVDVDVDVVDVDVDVLDVDRWLGSSRSQDFPSWSRCTRRWARCCPPRDACVGNNI